MPLSAVIPRLTRLAAPAPLANTSGRTPSTKESAVIRTARNRRTAAFLAASPVLRPDCRSCIANSTIRMAVLVDSSTEFASFRRGRSDFSSVTIYRAKEELIKGHCEIWAWGNADSAYVCTVGAPDPKVATARYIQAVEQVSSCLGAEWSFEEDARKRDGQTDGIATRFRHPDSTKPVVSVHNIEDHLRRSVYLYIGSPARAF